MIYRMLHNDRTWNLFNRANIKELWYNCIMLKEEHKQLVESIWVILEDNVCNKIKDRIKEENERPR